MNSPRIGMIDISAKPVTSREAVASCRIHLEPQTIKLIRENKIKKGDVLSVAQCAAILAAKKVDELIPLCHPVPLEYVQIDFKLERGAVLVTATCKTRSRTGVEMEAMTACAVAALTIYDMCKYVDRGAVISQIMLKQKSGGKSGLYQRR